ncbi:hypothetical protein DPMN_126720 [Dreissena polymorpha]|uniref:Secreted protein n=1 Tax=Dreissena polymorpha TaxID=45954 RepID=A0A9D4GWA0_DREPO|nr:hypothetical protein DPMN_126720 [Dreissena polymorpha]
MFTFLFQLVETAAFGVATACTRELSSFLIPEVSSSHVPCKNSQKHKYELTEPRCGKLGLYIVSSQISLCSLHGLIRLTLSAFMEFSFSTKSLLIKNLAKGESVVPD